MLASLLLHPDYRCDAVDRIDVELDRPSARSVQLRYRVSGAVSDLALPASARPERTDGLWNYSCFEFFLGREEGPGYVEFNFAPSSRWAAYSFRDRRSGMALLETTAPAIETQAGEGWYELTARIELPDLGGADLRMGLSAVIEEARGPKSYWALAHPPGKADFHHPDCFALHLPPAK